MSVIIKDMEMPKTCSQCEIWSKCWDERPFWFERLEYCPLTEMSDRKTEPQTNADQHVQDVGSVESVEQTERSEDE